MFMAYVNNKGADQSVHLCISRLASFWSWTGRFESYLVENPEDRFSHDVADIIEPEHVKTNKFTCLPSEDADQP